MGKFDYSRQPGRIRTRTYSPDPREALVSIITPFYNAGRYFEQTFNSVMNQTFPWFEWIIVDDGSTKAEDLELLDCLTQKDGRIRLIHQPNSGLSCARNTGVRNSNTDLVVPLDADDILEPQYVECTYFCMMYHPEAAWCYTSTHGFQDQEYEWHYPFDAEKLKTYNFLNYIGMIRKKDIEEVAAGRLKSGPILRIGVFGWKCWPCIRSRFMWIPVCSGIAVWKTVCFQPLERIRNELLSAKESFRKLLPRLMARCKGLSIHVHFLRNSIIRPR